MIKIRCKNCNVELEGHPTKLKSCGCSNVTSIVGNTISANNLELVELISGINIKKVQTSKSILSSQDLEFQESRKTRRVRKLEFEIR